MHTASSLPRLYPPSPSYSLPSTFSFGQIIRARIFHLYTRLLLYVCVCEWYAAIFCIAAPFSTRSGARAECVPACNYYKHECGRRAEWRVDSPRNQRQMELPRACAIRAAECMLDFNAHPGFLRPRGCISAFSFNIVTLICGCFFFLVFGF